MSYEFHSRTEIVLEIRCGGNYFEPEELHNSLILCDLLTHNKKFMHLMQAKQEVHFLFGITFICEQYP